MMDRSPDRETNRGGCVVQRVTKIYCLYYMIVQTYDFGLHSRRHHARACVSECVCACLCACLCIRVCGLMYIQE